MKTSKTTIIEAPVSLVWQILQDIDLATTWVPMLTSYRLISEAPNQVGSIYESEHDYKGMQYKQTGEIKAYVENEYIRWKSTTPFCDGKLEYHLTPISETQTEFKHVSECQYKGFSKFWSWLTKSKMQKTSDDMWNETHRNFKSLVEMTYWSGDEHP